MCVVCSDAIGQWLSQQFRIPEGCVSATVLRARNSSRVVCALFAFAALNIENRRERIVRGPVLILDGVRYRLRRGADVDRVEATLLSAALNGGFVVALPTPFRDSKVRVRHGAQFSFVGREMAAPVLRRATWVAH